MSEELSMHQVYIKQLEDTIETHIADEQFGVKELAKELGVSRSQLHRKLQIINGKSTSQYIREYRLEKAMELLQDNVATASEIAYRVGFGSPTYFNSCFKNYYGFTPGEVKFRVNSSGDALTNIEPSIVSSEADTLNRKLFNLRNYAIGALAVISVISFMYFNFTNPESTETADTKTSNPIENSIAVLPFTNMSGNSENEAFCDGMTTAIISRLSKIKGISKVISHTTMMGYKDNQKTISEIADELKVHFILESGFQKSGNNIKINLQIIEGTSDKLYWSEEYAGRFDSIFKIQARVAEMVAKQLDVDISEEEQISIKQALTDNMGAYENYLQGVLIFSYDKYKSTDRIIASRKYFEKAISLDSTFAEAYLELGRTYSMMGTWYGKMSKKKADSLAFPYIKKAHQLDPNNIELLTYLAGKEFFNWNFRVADSMFSVIRHERGDFFYSDFLNLILGRYDQVIESGHNNLKENPKSELIFPITYAYYHKGELDSTLHIINTNLRLVPNSEPIYDHFGNILLALGDYEKAKDLIETGLQISDKRHASMVVHLSLAYHYLGNEEKSLKLLDEVIDRAKNGEPEINVVVAHYYARVGNRDEAFKWLDIAYNKHEVDLIWLKADPNLMLLKDDFRYGELCKKVGFLEMN